MSILIEIKSPVITEVNGTSKAGKPYHMRKQSAWAYTYDQHGKPHPYPERIEFNLMDDQQAFPAGRYSIAPQSFFVGDFNALSIGRLLLEPVKQAGG